MIIRENIDFKRGLEPRKSLKIGIKEANENYDTLRKNLILNFPELNFRRMDGYIDSYHKFTTITFEDNRSYLYLGISEPEVSEKFRVWFEKNTNYPDINIKLEWRNHKRNIDIDVFRDHIIEESISDFKRGMTPAKSLGIGEAGIYHRTDWDWVDKGEEVMDIIKYKNFLIKVCKVPFSVVTKDRLADILKGEEEWLEPDPDEDYYTIIPDTGEPFTQEPHIVTGNEISKGIQDTKDFLNEEYG